MGLIRKVTSVSTLGAVDFRSDKERAARYAKQGRDELRKQTRMMAGGGGEEQDSKPGWFASLPTRAKVAVVGIVAAAVVIIEVVGQSSGTTNAPAAASSSSTTVAAASSATLPPATPADPTVATSNACNYLLGYFDSTDPDVYSFEDSAVQKATTFLGPVAQQPPAAALYGTLQELNGWIASNTFDGHDARNLVNQACGH